ncbi:MAG TPA: DUF4388 domain-containing protein [Pyrinomonadaceae bacterium]|nr:DUF4388 domain-containing protein [Pyrinomonadaceae bacterium]
MALTGHLSDLSLSELIEFFCNQRKTGQLKVLYPQGPGYFYLQTGSVVDARIGVLRGIDAVYYALTLPNARFEFSGSTEATERTINQPWTQVVLEGLRRLDEGITPAEAFTDSYRAENEDEDRYEDPLISADLTKDSDPALMSFLQNRGFGRSHQYITAAVVVAILASVAVIGVPAGWYRRADNPPVAVAEPAVATPTEQPTLTEATETVNEQNVQSSDEAALAAKRQRERARAARETQNTALNQSAPTFNRSPKPTAATDGSTSGPRRVTVTVTYDESGRVTQASGADATAVRIARQKRFPAGKAGSATVVIPIN